MLKQRDTLDFCRRVLRDRRVWLNPCQRYTSPQQRIARRPPLLSRLARMDAAARGRGCVERLFGLTPEECFRIAAFWTIAGQIAERCDGAYVVEDFGRARR